eukprot:9694037-Lingulodinium_polyedra.AAC.1
MAGGAEAAEAGSAPPGLWAPLSPRKELAACSADRAPLHRAVVVVVEAEAPQFLEPPRRCAEE